MCFFRLFCTVCLLLPEMLYSLAVAFGCKRRSGGASRGKASSGTVLVAVPGAKPLDCCVISKWLRPRASEMGRWTALRLLGPVNVDLTGP